LESRRRKAVALSRRGYRRSRVAHRLKTTPQTVGRWLRFHARRGSAGLAAKPVAGRPPRLSIRQRRDLVKRLLKGAMASGFATDPWTGRRVAQLTYERYGVKHHARDLPRLLKGLGFSPSEARAPSFGTRRKSDSPLD
jgi:transposase